MATTRRNINAIDLFSGAGGFSLGIEQSGINVVAAIEYDKAISKTYSYNHPSTIMINEDINNVKVNKKDTNKGSILLSEKIDISNIDVIFGGPPCQGFSMSGLRIRKNTSFLEDARNKLFIEFYRFVKYIKPSIFIIENVPGILNYNNGSVKKEINELFSKLGYDISAQILSAEHFGVPQKRQRAFFIGNNLGISSETLFPSRQTINTEIVTLWESISDLPSLKSGEGTEPCSYNSFPQSSYQNIMRDTKHSTFYNHVAPKHTKKTIELLELIKPGESMKNLPKKYRTKSVHSGAYGRMEKDKPSYTLTTRLNTPSVGRITHPVDHRTITPREAARIQSFPDSYRFLGNITSVGMQIGNSVPPLLAKSIGTSIIKILK